MSGTRPSPARAARAEAAGKVAQFVFDGETYTIAPSADWDLDVLDRFEDGRVLGAVTLVLGPEQMKRFRSKPRTIGDLNALFDEAQRAAGIAGN
ncbi:hypothetical protein [Micromonospora sp. KC213]|uniref:hypothetical protein n=1 Tax=Micromonospora sp. KC213 TaxID=2530378 RepID=UPI001048F2B6|nr:hypothetical protein [Micromonospora sp. KC213]TDC33460.1 hypothetical protein E1166_25665 [Micromonospora sp. KC213]